MRVWCKLHFLFLEALQVLNQIVLIVFNFDINCLILMSYFYLFINVKNSLLHSL